MNKNISIKYLTILSVILTLFCVIFIILTLFYQTNFIIIGIFILTGISFIIYNFFLIILIKNLKKNILSQRKKHLDVYKTLQEINLELIKEKNTMQYSNREVTGQLEKSGELKTNFFINFANEARMVLSLAVNHFYKLNDLLRKRLNDKQAFQYMDIIIKSHEKIQKDLIDFLDMEKFEKGEMIYDHNETVKLKPLLEKEIELFKEITETKNIDISYDLDDLYIKIDTIALDRIIKILFDNAIKYNKENGQISITLKSVYHKVLLTIKDTGIGMNKKQIEYIFNPYQNILHDKKGYQGIGIGIGLNIVNHIVKQVGGEIIIESEENSGSSFIVIFPESKKEKNILINKSIKISKPAEYADVKILLERHLSNLPTILIVDDDINLLKYLQMELYEIFNVYYAKNGREALEKINNIPKPDLIISDIMMNEMNGFEFKNSLYEKNKYKAIPFIFLTAQSANKEKIKGYVKGAISYITKPFNISELFVTISSIIDFTMLQKKINNTEFHEKLSSFLKQHDTKTYIEKNDFEYICYKNNISNMEKEIIKFILQGKEYKQIADELNKAFNTIRNQTQSIMKKLKIKNKRDLFKIFNTSL